MFYLGIRESVQDQKDKDQIEKVIREEMNHFFLLNKQLTEAEKQLN
jgi:rubrerythrin